MKNVDSIMTWGIVALAIALVGVMIMSCSRCEFLYTECRPYEDRYGYYEICEDVYDCRSEFGRRVYATADAQTQYDNSLVE